MSFELIDEYKNKMTTLGLMDFTNYCDEVKSDNKRFSKKEVEETAIKLMLKAQNKELLFKKYIAKTVDIHN